MITVRAATLDDAQAINIVMNNGWRWAYQGIVDQDYLDEEVDGGAEHWEKVIGENRFPDRPLLVACEEDEVVGCIGFGASRDEELPVQGEVYMLYVHANCSGRGAGSAMWKEAERQLRERGYDGMCALVLQANNIGCNFYEKIGCIREDKAFTTVIGKQTLPEYCYTKRF